jgi:ABC-type transport system substrate-binding protein
MTDRTEHPTHSHLDPTRRAFLGAGALALLGLAAPPLVGPARAQSPKRGGTLVVAADVSPPGLDPQKSAAAHSWMIAEHVYSNLLRRDPKMNIAGDLAESWQVVNDTTFVFKLRKGVVWHHGRDLVADDVKYSFERMLDEKTASPWRSNWLIIDRIETPDRSTVRFVIKRPFAPFFSYLATPHYSAIVPRDLVEKHGAADSRDAIDLAMLLRQYGAAGNRGGERRPRGFRLRRGRGGRTTPGSRRGADQPGRDEAHIAGTARRRADPGATRPGDGPRDGRRS